MPNANNQQIQRWERYLSLTKNRTLPAVRRAINTARVAGDMHAQLEKMFPIRPPFGSDPLELLTEKDQANARNLEMRAKILDNQIANVLLQKYALQFDGPHMNIVAPKNLSEDEYASDIYPATELNLGVAPVIVAAGIVAVALLINADEQSEQLLKEAEIERMRLTKKMIEVDQMVLQQGGEAKNAWERWKKPYHELLKKSAAGRQTLGWLERIFGKTATQSAAIGLVAILGISILAPKLLGALGSRKNNN